MAHRWRPVRSRLHDDASLRRRLQKLPWTLAFLASVRSAWACWSWHRDRSRWATAYAVWGGIGAVGTVVVGCCGSNEPATTVPLLLIPCHRRRNRCASADRLSYSGHDQELFRTGHRRPLRRRLIKVSVCFGYLIEKLRLTKPPRRRGGPSASICVYRAVPGFCDNRQAPSYRNIR